MQTDIVDNLIRRALKARNDPREVMTDPALRHCPHGRPVALTLSKAELGKRFLRG